MIRHLYEALLRLYPAPFRDRFGAEILCVFDETHGTRARLWLLADVLASLAKQRMLRPREQPAPASANGAPAFVTVDLPSHGGRLVLRGLLPAAGLCIALSLAMKHSGRNPGFYFDPYFERARVAVQGAIRTQVEGANSDAGQLPPVPAPVDEVIRALRLQFRTYDAVALGEWHGSGEDSEIRLELIRSPGFASVARNVVFECANSLHQGTLDKFLAGADVPATKLRNVWRDVLTPGACDDPVYEQFLREARDARLRVLAAGPPIDWARVKSPADVAAFVRNSESFAAGVLQGLLRRGEKVLVIFGAGHLWRNTLGVAMPDDSTLVSRIDREFPGRLFTVLRMTTPAQRQAMFLPLRGGSIGGLDANTHIGRGLPMPLFPAGTLLEQVADAVIFSGSAQQRAGAAAAPNDPEWAAEIERRMKLRRGK